MVLYPHFPDLVDNLDHRPKPNSTLSKSIHFHCYTLDYGQPSNSLFWPESHSLMNYYSCQIEEIHKEIRRRGYIPFGTNDQLSESLTRDDDARETDATTVYTKNIGDFVPRELNLLRTAEFGESVLPSLLANEKIIYWTMNTFFPTLQLFFESGLSCTIDGSRLPDATVGLDPRLRFRLTDCTHEEEGHLFKTTLPAKFARSGTGLVIREACIARRVSIAVKPAESVSGSAYSSPSLASTTIIQEHHWVVGLRLEGMSKMGYVWAKVGRRSGNGDRIWGDVRLAGLRKDVPAPFLGYPEHTMKPGGQVTVVTKESMASGSAWEDKTWPFWKY
ncbi:Nn.00g058690.m01.CDS01 [Neocucurbitaria sp. VM-36]